MRITGLTFGGWIVRAVPGVFFPLVRLALAAAVLALASAATAQAETASVTVNEPAPVVYGQTVSFTEIVPQAALKSSRKPQFPNEPNTQIDCSQAGVHAFEEHTSAVSKRNIGGGYFQLVTGDVVLAGQTWTGGGATCTATVYSVSEKNGVIAITVWATVEFDVSA